MARPTGIFGESQPYLAKTGQDVFDTPLGDLPPITRAVRASFLASSPVASADAIAALFVAIHDLETRVIALEA